MKWCIVALLHLAAVAESFNILSLLCQWSLMKIGNNIQFDRRIDRC